MFFFIHEYSSNFFETETDSIEKRFISKMTPSEVVGSLIKIGDWCIKMMIAFQNNF